MLLFFILLLIFLSILSTYFTARLIYSIVQCLTGQRSIKKLNKPTRTLIVIGSGGHTAEMMRLMDKMNKSTFTPRLYALADTDTTSRNKIESNEQDTHWSIAYIPRSRHVNQSFLTSILSTIHAICIAIPVVASFKPDLVLCNGPGTCVPICFVAFMMRIFHYADTSIIFVESICRVKTLSLTGKLMIFFADMIIVQWPELKQTYGWRVKYLDEGLSS